MANNYKIYRDGETYEWRGTTPKNSLGIRLYPQFGGLQPYWVPSGFDTSKTALEIS